MTNSLLDLSARADLAWLAELIGDARQAAPSVEWLVVGALARDLHLSYAHGIRVDRVTTDTDLALTIATWAEFAHIRHTLLASGNFVADRRIEHKLLHRSGRALDVVPFGDIEDRSGTIAWPPSGAVTMSVLGYREAFAGSITLIRILTWCDTDFRLLFGECTRCRERRICIVGSSRPSVTERTQTTQQHPRARSGSCGKARAHRAIRSARCRGISHAAGSFSAGAD